MFELIPFENNRHLSNYNPFKELEDLEKNFWGGSWGSSFKTDIKDTGNGYEMEADLPGFKKEDIHVDVEDGYLTIQAERHSEQEKKDQKGNYIRCERRYGSFSRSFDITGIQADQIKVSYQDGVLKLVLPKAEETKPAARRLEIE